jgi:glutamate synthase domain-containing protein 3
MSTTGLDTTAVGMTVADLDLDIATTREVNRALRALAPGARAVLRNPRGRHNLAVGLDADIDVGIAGPVGYYVSGLGKKATVRVAGPAGPGAGENLMSGLLDIAGDASSAVGASARGGTVVVRGNASLRAAISLKGATVVVGGDVGSFCGFLAQAGTVLIGGDTGAALGDSIYEAVFYVGGRIGGLGTDARVEDLTAADVALVAALVQQHGLDHIDPQNVTRVASAKQLYHFDTAHTGAY